MRRILAFAVVVVLLAASLSAQIVKLPGMHFNGKISRDANGVTQIEALNHHDLYFLQGYSHAQDRLFQMDYYRRIVSGTLAELLGPPALPNDVQLRAVGLRAAAQATYDNLSLRGKAAVNAYSEGVNAYLASNPTLPPEYGAIEITKVQPWTPVDSVSVAKLITFQLSFDTSDITSTIAFLSYQAAGRALGFDGAKLFTEDLFRFAPFDPAATIPDATRTSSLPDDDGSSFAKGPAIDLSKAAEQYHPALLDLAKHYVEQIRNVPILGASLEKSENAASNMWGIRGTHTTTGNAIMANDPHLALDALPIWYLNSLRAGRTNVVGFSIPGVPSVIVGRNRHVAWGSTVNPADQTDIYQEQFIPDAASPTGLAFIHAGQKEFVFGTLQTWRANIIGDKTMDNLTTIPPSGSNPPPATLLVTRHGPVIALDATTGIALTVRHVGLAATRDLETFLIFNDARNIDEFKEGLKFFDGASQNFSYSDSAGNIAYFAAGEIPIREDLKAGTVTGAPPWLIRTGSGGNEWVRNLTPPPDQASHFEILSLSEMPQVVNPAAGWFVNANNDPTGATNDNNPLNQPRAGGGGIFYLNPYYAGYRAGRITAMIRQKLANGGKISPEDSKAMQADTVMIDAQYFVPYIVKALENAKATGADAQLALFAASPGVNAAVDRLSRWDGSTPTGIIQGMDAADVNGQPSPPSQSEIDASVAATIYHLWRSHMIRYTIDAVLAPANLPRPPGALAVSALRNLFDKFPTQQGRGVSGVNFFNVTGVTNAEARRDIIVLKALADSLTLLASDTFKDAFNNSTNLDDYRWGKLHRIVLRHPLGATLSVPPAAGGIPHPLGAALPGFPVDGGWEVVDRSDPNPRGMAQNDFMFFAGASNRANYESGNGAMKGDGILAGGNSIVPGAPAYLNFLGRWLTNDYVPMMLTSGVSLPWLR